MPSMYLDSLVSVQPLNCPEPGCCNGIKAEYSTKSGQVFIDGRHASTSRPLVTRAFHYVPDIMPDQYTLFKENAYVDGEVIGISTVVPPIFGEYDKTKLVRIERIFVIARESEYAF